MCVALEPTSATNIKIVSLHLFLYKLVKTVVTWSTFPFVFSEGSSDSISEFLTLRTFEVIVIFAQFAIRIQSGLMKQGQPTGSTQHQQLFRPRFYYDKPLT